MKTLMTVSILILSLNSFGGDREGNGGDICENRIKEISVDIKNWINQDGHENLELPDNLSNEEYKQSMLEALKSPVIECKSDKIYTGELEKTCKNFEDEDQNKYIRCNFNRFQSLSDEEQYRLTHHEIAGLANIEVNDGDSSDYRISNQISGFLDLVVLKKLSVRPVNNSNVFGSKYNPELLFGDFPAKFYCIRGNRYSRGPKYCNMPTVLQMNGIIKAYEQDLNNRKKLFEDFKNQNKDYETQLIEIAQKKEDEIGENEFSIFYRFYANNLKSFLKSKIKKDLDRSINYDDNAWEKINLIISNESPYLEFLKKLRDSIAKNKGDIKSYADIVYDKKNYYIFNPHIKILDSLEKKKYVNYIFRYEFKNLIPLEESCTKFSGYGSFSNTKVTIETFDVHPDYNYGFKLIEEKEFIETILTGNQGRPIKIECEKVKTGTSLKPFYDHEDGTLTIPYYIERGFSSIPDSLGWEFTKSIIYEGNGYFDKALRDQFKRPNIQ